MGMYESISQELSKPSKKEIYIILARSHRARSNKYKNQLNYKGKEPKNSAKYLARSQLPNYFSKEPIYI